MDTQGMKQEGRGRTRRSAEVRRELVEAFRFSGETATAFCAQRGINLNTFYNWLAKDRKAAQGPVFQEVLLPFPVADRQLRVCLPNRVEVFVPMDSSAALSLVLREAAGCLG
jgi:transposase-like protein